MSIFLDSSILVEYTKRGQGELAEALLTRGVPLFYNSIVLTEYVYYFLGLQGGKSPRTLKEAGRIPTTLSQRDPLALLQFFEEVTDRYPSSESVVRLMRTYNLLPNDAIILAHCLSLEIQFLASHDTTDFAVPCRAEGVTLLDSLAALDLHVPAA